MNGKLCWGLAVVTLLGTALNAAEPGRVVIRGQSPTPTPATEAAPVPTVAVEAVVTGPLIGSAPGYGELSKKPKKDFKTFPEFHDNNFGYEGGYYAGPEGYYAARHRKAYTYGHGGMGEGCPYCNYGDACPPSGCPHCKCHGKGPKHYTTYEYKWPDNLVYPQYGAPAGMVQYPYYTLRGPTDFFMK